MATAAAAAAAAEDDDAGANADVNADACDDKGTCDDNVAVVPKVELDIAIGSDGVEKAFNTINSHNVFRKINPRKWPSSPMTGNPLCVVEAKRSYTSFTKVTSRRVQTGFDIT